MPKVAELLEREGGTVELEPGHFERLLRRRDRKRRNQRIRAGALAIILVLVTAAALARTFNSEERTATPPAPTPTDTAMLGSLAYALDGDIYVADWDGGNPVRIADGLPLEGVPGCSAGGYWAEGPIWSPDGRYLAYRHDYCQDAQELREVMISDPEGNVVASFPGEGWLISWSPDSTRVAVWVRWGKTIGVYGLDGVRQTLLTLPPGLMAAGDFDPVWTRDGASLLVPNGVEVPLDGRTPRQLPPDDPRSLVRATYSPDGSRIAYLESSSFEPPYVNDIDGAALVVASADGSGARELVCCRVSDFAWSPTGDRIAFFNTGAAELRVIDVASGTVTRLAGMETTAGVSLQFSPDGDRILFSRTPGSTETSLWTVDADGSDLRRLVIGTTRGDWQTTPTSN